MQQIKFYMPFKVNQEQRAYLAWNILVEYAKNGIPITYSELARRIGVHHRAIRFILDVLYDYCVEDGNIPLLSGIVIGKNTKKPGIGFTDFNGKDLGLEFEKVFSFPWQNFINPFEFAKDGSKEQELIDILIQSPDDAETVYSKVKVRGITQILFRKALLEAYDFSCAICGLTFQEALEACHIIPYSECTAQQKLDIRNGLLLCSVHHKLFDNGYIVIDSDYKISYCDMEEALSPYSDYDRLLSLVFDKKLLTLPNNENHFPDKNYLQQHRNSHVD